MNLARAFWVSGVLGIAVTLLPSSLVAHESHSTRHAHAIAPPQRAAFRFFIHADPPPIRSHYGYSDLYAPTFFHARNGAYDLIVHFHGMSSVQEENIERAQVNAVIVSVNLGMGSGPYEDAFRDPHAFSRLVAWSTRVVERSGRVPGAHLGRVAVSAWSAGYGAVSSLLRQPSNSSRLDAVLLEDGLHSNYANEKKKIVDQGPLVKFARVAEAAMRGEKLFALTHSAIPTEGYPCTTETIGELLKMTGMEKVPHLSTGPRTMLQIYESDRKDFHVKGYEGTGVSDHIDHLRGMNLTVLPYLRTRWDR